jgi:hypothetical protein
MSAEQLLKEAGQLSPSELDQFVSKIINLRAQRSAPNLPARESELLRLINKGLPPQMRRRLADLEQKRDAEMLSDNEQEELKRLSLDAEAIEAERLKYLSELAGLRGKSLADLMESLGLNSPLNG